MADDLKFKVGWDGREGIAGVQELASEVKGLNQWLKDSRESVTSLNAWLEVLEKSALSLKDVWSFAKDIAGAAEAKQQLSALAASVGQFGDAIIEASRKATNSQVSDAELVANSLAAMRQGVAKSSGDIAKLWEIADIKSDQFGGSIAENFKRITDAIATGNARSLISLGLLPESFGRAKTAAELLAKRGELLGTVFKQFGEDVTIGSQVGQTASDSFNQFDASVANLKDSFSEFLPLMQPVIVAMTDMVNQGRGVVESLANHRDEIGMLASAYAGAKIVSFAIQFGELAISIGKAASAQGALNLLAMANPYLILAAAIGATTYEYVQMRKEVDKLTGETAGLETAIDQMATSGNFRLAQVRLEAEKLRLSFLEVRKAASDEAFSREQANLKYDQNVSKLSFEDGSAWTPGMERAFSESQELKKLIDETKGRIAYFEAHAVPGFGRALAAAESLLGVASGLSGGFSKAGEAVETVGDKSGEAGNKVEDLLGIVGNIESEFGNMIDLANNDLSDAFETIVEGIDKLSESIEQDVASLSGWVDATEGFVYRLQHMGRGMSDHKPSLEKLTPEQAQWGLMNVVSGGLLDHKNLQSKAKLETELRSTIEEPLSRVFHDAWVASIEGNEDFFGALRKGLRSALVNAIGNQITSSIFGQGGLISSVINTGSRSSAASSVGQAASAVSSGGGGFSIFRPMTYSKAAGGGINWGNVGTNVAIGAALQFLTSPGRLLGGTKVNGQEAVQQASDINSRVSQARTDRQALIGTVGLSEDTVKKLSDLVFWTAGYNKNESGDGWFKGPKTTTYELNATQANAALEEFTKLTKQAQVDLAKRAYEIGTTQLDRPFTALQMSLDDLREALNRTVDEESRYALQLQIKQAESQKQSFWAGNLNDWTSFLLSTPMAGFGSDRLLQYQYTPTAGGNADPNSQPGVRANILWGDPQQNQTWDLARLFDPESTAMQRFRRGFFTPEGTYKIGDTTMNPEEFESWAGTQVMMQGLRNQGSSAWDIQEQIARGTKPWDVQVEGQKYTDILTDRLGGYQTMLDELDEKISDETLTMAQRSQLFSQFTAALTAYYGAKQEALDLELQQEADLKNKRDQRTDDILGTLLSRVGEISTNKAGQQVIVLSPGQPDGRALAREIIDAIGGEKPELATALTQFLNQTAKPYF
jgi:hypothetical protein